MIIAFYAKDKDLSKDIMDSIKAVLENDGHTVIYLDALDSVEKIDRVVAFGGDGTMLKTAVYAVKRSIPVIGVNLGNTGFLAYMNVTDDPTTIAEAILSSHYETRTLICVEYKGITHMALNDVFIVAVKIITEFPQYDHQRMLKKCVSQRHSFGQMSNLESMLQEFTRIYNYKQLKADGKLYFEEYMRNIGYNVRDYDSCVPPSVDNSRSVKTTKNIKNE